MIKIWISFRLIRKQIHFGLTRQIVLEDILILKKLKSGTITSIKSSDVNRDSLDDIILVHHSLNKIEVLLNNKNNNFTSTFMMLIFIPIKLRFSILIETEFLIYVRTGKLHRELQSYLEKEWKIFSRRSFV